MSFELSATNLTDTSVSLVMTLTSNYDSDTVVSFSFQQGGSSGQTVYTTSATILSGAQTGDEITTDIGDHLTASTTYYVAATISGGVLVDDLTITTKATGYNTPRTATQEQWEDLANRVGAKANAGDVPTITMTDVDPGEDSPLAANNFVAVYGGDPIIMDYSTTETNTGAKWIDGKTIYKKTVDTGALPNNSIKTVAHGITGINKIIKMEGYAYRSSPNTLWVNLNWPSVATAASSIAIGADLTNISVFTGTDRTAFTESYVTLYYTKSS